MMLSLALSGNCLQTYVKDIKVLPKFWCFRSAKFGLIAAVWLSKYVFRK